MNNEKEKVKEHYQGVASCRNSRIKSSGWNIHKYNHKTRLGIIEKLVKKNSPFQRGLDIGTGTGVWAEVLSRYCDEVLGIDFAEENIKIARNNAKNLGIDSYVKYSLGDAENLGQIKNNYYDIVLHISVLQHIENQEKAIKRVHDILKGRGTFIILVHNKNCLYNRSLHSSLKREDYLGINKYFSVGQMKNLLAEKDFEIKGIRCNWLFLSDFIFLGYNKKYLKPLKPVRIFFQLLFFWIDFWLGRITFLNFLFREIIVVARKK